MADNKENSEDNGRATQPAQPKPLIPPPSLVTPLAPSLATPIQSIPTPPPPPAVSHKMQATKAPVKHLAPSAPSLTQGQPLQAGVQTIQSPRSTQSFVNQRVQTTQLPYQTNQQQLPYQTNQLPYQTNQQYQQQPQRSSVSGIRAGAVGFSLLAGLFPLPFNPLFLPIQMTIFIIMIIILLFKGWDFWTAALLAWLIPGLIAAVLHYMIIGGVLSVMGMGEGEATN